MRITHSAIYKHFRFFAISRPALLQTTPNHSIPLHTTPNHSSFCRFSSLHLLVKILRMCDVLRICRIIPIHLRRSCLPPLHQNPSILLPYLTRCPSSCVSAWDFHSSSSLPAGYCYTQHAHHVTLCRVVVGSVVEDGLSPPHKMGRLRTRPMYPCMRTLLSRSCCRHICSQVSHRGLIPEEHLRKA